MDCPTMQEHVSAFIDRELRPSEEPELFAHLASCSSCREFFHEARTIRAGMREERPLRAPATLDRRVLGGSVRRQPTGAAPLAWLDRAWHSRLTVPFPVAASIAAVVLAVVLSLARGPAGGPRDREIVYVMTLPVVEVEATLPAVHPAFH